MVLLSVVIPVYNAEEYLADSIDSVLTQSFSDFELILVNDGSSDGSLDICKAYAMKDRRVRIYSQHNQGQAAARNRGIDLAIGKYIGFCDNDDVLHPDIFQILINNMESTQSEVSACSYREVDSKGNVFNDSHTGETYYFSNEESMREFLSREKMDIYVWTKIYARHFLEKNHIRFESGRNDEDFLFNHQVFLCVMKTVFVDKALYDYRVRETSECRVYYKKDLNRYLHNTLYRVYKIESITKEKYPQFLTLAKRQSIRYHIMMIGRSIQTKYRESEPYFSYIMRYLRQNRKQVIACRTYWGMSLPGVILMVILPTRFYFFYRHVLEKIRNRN